MDNAFEFIYCGNSSSKTCSITLAKPVLLVIPKLHVSVPGQEAFKADQLADSIYHSYNVFINTAKALLMTQGVKTNTQTGIVKDFGGFVKAHPEFKWQGQFPHIVYNIKKNEPTQAFALTYLKQAIIFYEAAEAFRRKQISDETNTTP